MTSTTIAAAQSYCTEVINPADFSTNIKDVLRDTWTVGKMYHLIKALDGRPVIMVGEQRTGHTLFNVALTYTYNGANGPRVRTVYTYDVAPERGTGRNETDYRLYDCGTVVVMPQADGRMTSVKYDAMDSYRKHQSAAIDLAMKQAEGTGREWGVWKATVLDGQRVDVTYTPSTGNEAFADKWGERGYWRITVQG